MGGFYSALDVLNWMRIGRGDSDTESVACDDSCRTETLSTLRFAQRAKSIQNKAVVNEETGNDVNLLREQIRQLKVCLRCVGVVLDEYFHIESDCMLMLRMVHYGRSPEHVSAF